MSAANPAAGRFKTYYRSLDPLVLWTQPPRPRDWTQEFGRLAPLEIDIGFGNGESLLRRAGERPDINLVGLELAWASVKRALRRIAARRADNIRLMQIDAQVALERLFAPGTVSRMAALFPVPWPKERHEKRRLFSAYFLRLAASRLRDQGRLEIVTDSEALAEWVLTQVPDTGFEADLGAIDGKYKTKYERKWREGGQETFFELILTKVRSLEAGLAEDLPLFNFRLPDFNPDEFSPANHQGPLTVKFKDFIFDPRRQKGMLLAFVAEDRLIQEVWIKIANEGGHWFLGLAQNNHVVPTMGVKLALELARDAALSPPAGPVPT